ncbi:MAG TPA: phosphotransferase [Solirubrobacteraceae bacterium]|jgi:aminoglycoside phosphotransferase (APT) family kinase protein
MPAWDPEVDVDERLARTLIRTHFPTLDWHTLRRIGAGWDNTVWATADGIAFRFPRREIAIPGVEREIAILPALAPHLPLAIPEATHVGRPSDLFRWPWFGSRLITGCELAEARYSEAQRTALAPLLGLFLRTLHNLPLHLAQALPVDPLRRADMAVRVPMTREALAEVATQWAAPGWVGELLEEAEQLPAAAQIVLVHGDLHIRHLLVDEARGLTGVIDWGDTCRAHPCIDLSLYWSLLPPAGRAAFLTAYGSIEHDELIRARVLALFLCATLAAYAHAEGMQELEREAISGLQRAVLY